MRSSESCVGMHVFPIHAVSVAYGSHACACVFLCLCTHMSMCLLPFMLAYVVRMYARPPGMLDWIMKS